MRNNHGFFIHVKISILSCCITTYWPVCAHAIRSLLARMIGIAYFCTGVGFSYLLSIMLFLMMSPRSMSENCHSKQAHLTLLALIEYHAHSEGCRWRARLLSLALESLICLKWFHGWPDRSWRQIRVWIIWIINFCICLWLIDTDFEVFNTCVRVLHWAELSWVEEGWII